MQTSHISSVGIDFGSQRSVVAVAKKGGVDVLANEGSHRETQNVIGFGEKERFIGEQGALQMKSNYKNTVNFFNRFLGVQGRPPFFRNETRWLTAQNEINEQGKLIFSVQYNGNQYQFTPEQLTATMLNKLKDIIQKNGIVDKNVVISVPAYYTEQERKALLDACRIAELPVERLLNETAAIATSYGLFRKNDLDSQTPRYVAFVDFGHSKTSVFVGSFLKEKAQIVVQYNERNFGARDLDWGLFEHFCEVFEKESGGLKPQESKKGQLRLFEAIEKLRKVLSANSEAHLNVDYLVEDLDFNYTLSRVQYENLIEPQLQQFSRIMVYVALEIKKLNIDLHSVEIIGGGTRIPIIQQLILQSLGLDQVSKTLNASESIARGCAMMAAMKNPSFKVTEYSIEDINYYPIKVGWLYNSTLDQILNKQKGMDIEQVSLTNLFPEKQKPLLLFDKDCVIPSIKSVNLPTKTDEIEMTVFYDPAPPGFQSILLQLRIPPIKPVHPEFSTKIRFRFNPNGILNLEDVCLIEEYVEEKIIPKQNLHSPKSKMLEESKDNQLDQLETKKKKKQQLSTVINCEVSNFYSATLKEIEDCIDVEATMANQDNQTNEVYGSKNELEAYVYSMKDQLQGKLKEYTTTSENARIKKELDDEYEWLYGDGIASTKSQYITRLDNQRQQCDPIVQRYQDYTQTPEAVDDLLKVIHQTEQLAKTTDQKFHHITQDERNKIHVASHAARTWSQNALHKLQKKDKTKASDVNKKDVDKYQQEYIDKTEAIMNLYKPDTRQSQRKESQDSQPQKFKMETE